MVCCVAEVMYSGVLCGVEVMYIVLCGAEFMYSGVLCGIGVMCACWVC